MDDTLPNPLPGEELVMRGLLDLAGGLESVEALLPAARRPCSSDGGRRPSMSTSGSNRSSMSCFRALPAIKDALLGRNLTDASLLRAQFAEIEPRLYCFSAIDGRDFALRLEKALRRWERYAP